jgi:hypothetical protein
MGDGKVSILQIQLKKKNGKINSMKITKIVEKLENNIYNVVFNSPVEPYTTLTDSISGLGTIEFKYITVLSEFDGINTIDSGGIEVSTDIIYFLVASPAIKDYQL